VRWRWRGDADNVRGMLCRRRRLAHVGFVVSVHFVAMTSVIPVMAQSKPAPVAAPAASKAPQDLIGRGLSLFEDQQYEESIQTLSAALLRPNNTKAQKIDVYRLLALNYITLSRKDEAESAVRGLLAIEPSYALPPSESPRFRDFFVAVKQRWEAEGRPGLVKETEAPPAPVTMKHGSPPSAEASTQIDLTGHIDDPQHRVVDVRLYYRAGSRGKFEVLSATTDAGDVRASIPASVVKPPLVEYYFQGVDKGGLPVVARGDATAPLRIAIPEASRGWVLPVAIGGSVLGAGAIVGILALAGVFKSSSPSPGPGGNAAGTAVVNVSVGAFR
jgi:hypothetical protein